MFALHMQIDCNNKNIQLFTVHFQREDSMYTSDCFNPPGALITSPIVSNSKTIKDSAWYKIKSHTA